MQEKTAMLAMNALVQNTLILRQRWLQSMLDPRRNIDIECGHPLEISLQDYSLMYERGDIAARVVNLYPDETWVQAPQVYEVEDETETAFEKAWKVFTKKFKVNSMLQRADVLSGIGQFGIILLGVSDGRRLDQPLANIDERGEVTGEEKFELLYLRPLDQSAVEVKRMQGDETSPRYGQPQVYTIKFAENSLSLPMSDSVTVNKEVHWSRIIHVADNRTNSEIFGQPRMKRVMDRLLDLKKIAGGSAEMFWKGGFPGLSLQSLPGINPTDVEFDEAKTKEQMENYQQGLQRYLATIGMDVKSLSVQVADPSPQALLQIKLISTAMSVPWRIFIGGEVGQLSSDQDTQNWSKRISRRRSDYVDPFLIRPFVDRCIAIGALPAPESENYKITWPDLYSPSAEEKAAVADKKANALAKYIQAGADVLIPPYYFLTEILDLDYELALAIIDASEKVQTRLADTGIPPVLPKGAQAGDSATATAGRRNGILNPANNQE